MSGVFVVSPEEADKHPFEERDLAFVFEESVHSAIFFGFFDGTLDPDEWPQLYPMSDWYGEATYRGDDLAALVGELSRMVPRLPPRSAWRKALKGLLAVCRKAMEENRIVHWLGD
jgi:hypothetical protein